MNNKRRVTPVVASPRGTTYRLGDHVGSENRSTEFKAGIGFIHHDFRQNVAKYISAFVNSQQNGKLLVGVADDGKVVGIGVNFQLEDELRQKIDGAITDIDPQIFPDKYKVTFIPVLDTNGHKLADHHGPRVVLEIYVAGSEIKTDRKLCSTKQGVFMRRDGSVQSLTGAQIQQWVRRIYREELQRSKKELNQSQSELHRTQSELHRTQSELQRTQSELQRSRSNVNNLRQQARDLEFENTQLKEQSETLRSQVTQQEAEGGSLEEDIKELRQMMEDQRNTKQKRSIICVIS